MKGRPKIREGGRIGRVFSSRKAFRGRQKDTAGNVARLHQIQAEGSTINEKITTHLGQCLHRPIPPSRGRSVFASGPIERARRVLETRTTKARRCHTVIEWRPLDGRHMSVSRKCALSCSTFKRTMKFPRLPLTHTAS